MQTDYPCRIPRLKGKPLPKSFSFPKGSRCPAGEEEYPGWDTRCWQYAAIGVICGMPEIDKSSRILLLYLCDVSSGLRAVVFARQSMPRSDKSECWACATAVGGGVFLRCLSKTTAQREKRGLAELTVGNVTSFMNTFNICDHFRFPPRDF